MSTKEKIGEWGENEASYFLSNLGYEIIARKVRTPRGEIDILAKSDDGTTFVEVRTLTPIGSPTPKRRSPVKNKPAGWLPWKTTFNCMELTIGKSTP